MVTGTVGLMQHGRSAQWFRMHLFPSVYCRDDTPGRKRVKGGGIAAEGGAQRVEQTASEVEIDRERAHFC